MKIRSADFYLDPAGNRMPVPAHGLFDPQLKAGARRSLLQGVTEAVAIPAVASDLGHFCYPPQGALIHRLLQAYLAGFVRDELGAEQILTPSVFLRSARGVAEEAAAFLPYMYAFGDPEAPEMLLRPSGDYGAFSYVAATGLLAQDLPRRLFETGTAWRRIQRSRVSGIHSGRAYTLVDYHAFALDPDQLFDEWRLLLTAQAKALACLGQTDTLLMLEIGEAFFEENRAAILAILERLQRTAAVTLLAEPRNYWVLQHRFFRPDGLGLMDGQMDLTNAARYGIVVTGPHGQRTVPAICHGFWGTVERWMAVLLSDGMEGLPFWLKPVQLRLLPCSEAGEGMAERLAAAHRRRLRADIDRSGPLGERIKRAFKGGCHAVAVIGDCEAAEGEGAVTVRHADGSQHLGFTAWLDGRDPASGNFPFEPLTGSP